MQGVAGVKGKGANCFAPLAGSAYILRVRSDRRIVTALRIFGLQGAISMYIIITLACWGQS